MPIVFTAIFLYIMYSVKPHIIVNSFLISGIFVFYLMVWIGVSTGHNERIVEEQLLFLRAKNAFSYYLGKFLFLVCVSLLFVIICTGFPMILNATSGFDLFMRKLEAIDVVNAFLLQFGQAVMGATVGNLLHPRAMKDRTCALIITVLVAIIAMLVPSLKHEWPALKWILWVFPPVYLPSEIYTNATAFELKKVCEIVLLMLCYSTVFAVVKGILCNKKRW